MPGVGKSTFIETLGTQLTGQGQRVGVLAVDPSSMRTGGSVLGDKTRMAELVGRPGRLHPALAHGRHPRRCRPGDHAGDGRCSRRPAYDVVLVETVGVGQSEVTVAGMVDTFLFLTLARTGDQLQGIKKGILEIADVIAVNKADGDRAVEGSPLRRAPGCAAPRALLDEDWVPPVLTCSGLHGDGVEEVCQRVVAHRESMGDQGLAEKRAGQQLDFTWALLRDELDQRLRRSPGVKAIRTTYDASCWLAS